MNFFDAFAASFGSMLLITALIGAWLFRSTAPLIAKIAVPAVIVALACTTPYEVNTILGFPVLRRLRPCPAMPNSSPLSLTMTTREWIYGYARAMLRRAPMKAC